MGDLRCIKHIIDSNSAFQVATKLMISAFFHNKRKASKV